MVARVRWSREGHKSDGIATSANGRASRAPVRNKSRMEYRPVQITALHRSIFRQILPQRFAQVDIPTGFPRARSYLSRILIVDKGLTGQGPALIAIVLIYLL